MRGVPRRGSSGTGRPLGHEEGAVATSAPPSTAAARPAPAAGGVFKSAAVEVLRRERRLMTTGEICRLALEWGLLTCSGKTPEATMASALYGDLKRKDRNSRFIRPQEGMFGLREWVDQGFLPFWFLDGPAPASALPAAYGMHALAPAYGSGTYAAAGASNGGSLLAAGVSVLPLAAATAIATNSPTKRSAPATQAFHAGGTGSKGPGRLKKVRRSRGGQSEDEAWSDAAEGEALTDSEERGGSDCEDRLEPKQYSLRKGHVGRLQDAVAAAAAAPSPLRHGSTQDPSVLTAYLSGTVASSQPQQQQQQQQQQEQVQQQEAQPRFGALEPLELPNLRPASAEGSQARQGPGRRSSCGASGGIGVPGLLSPPLYAALLQSPLVAPSNTGSRAGNLASLFSPGTALPDFRSPFLPSPLLAAIGRTPACLSSLLSPLNPVGAPADGNSQHRPSSTGSTQRRQVAAALKGSAAAAAAGSLATAAPGTAVSTMVPVGEAAAGGVEVHDFCMAQHAQHAQHLPGMVMQLGARPGQYASRALPGQLAMVGESAGVAPFGGVPAGSMPRQLSIGIPEVVFKLPEPLGQVQGGAWLPAGAALLGAGANCEPVSSATNQEQACGGGRTRGAEGPGGAAGDAGRGSAGGDEGTAAGGGAQIAQKIREVEGKVRQVEERWGPVSLKTAQAHYLLHRACRHPQAAATFQHEAAQALQRAHNIVQQSRHLGLVDCQSRDYLQLAANIQEAVAAGMTGVLPGRQA